jgi:hypothetical protein
LKSRALSYCDRSLRGPLQVAAMQQRLEALVRELSVRSEADASLSPAETAAAAVRVTRLRVEPPCCAAAPLSLLHTVRPDACH